MIAAQESKIVAVTVPVAIKDNGSWTTVEIDTKDFDYCTVYTMLGVSDIAVAAMKIQESDTAGSGHADVTGLIFGTSNNTGGSASTLPSATDDGLIFGFEIDLRGRKRYLDLVFTAGDGSLGTYAVAWAVLSRAKDGPKNAAARGCSQILRV